MSPILLFLLSLYQLHTSTHGEVLNKPRLDVNALLENEDDLSVLLPPEVDELPESNEEIPFVKTGHDQTEVEFRHPISSVNIDYSRNMIVLKFRKDRTQLRFKLDPEEEEKRKALEANFMRFGRAPADFMRFGKRQMEEFPNANSIDSGYYEKEASGRQERSTEGLRDSRGDNFMRFGRASQDFMRFGRDPNKDFMRFGRAPADFMRFGRDANKDFMRFGRAPADFMRFGRDPNKDFMRFGRGGPDDFMRFGRNPADFMRFGRLPNKDFMRFGKAQKTRLANDNNFIRFGRPDNFMRFGRSPPEMTDTTSNFMRFGKSVNAEREQRNQTKPLLQKSDIRDAAKLLRQTDKDADESNPMDKAIKVFFSKQHQQEQQQQDGEQQQQLKSSDEAMDMDADYGFNMAN